MARIALLFFYLILKSKSVNMIDYSLPMLYSFYTLNCLVTLLTKTLPVECTQYAKYVEKDAFTQDLISASTPNSAYTNVRQLRSPELLPGNWMVKPIKPTNVHHNGVNFVCATETNGSQPSPEIVVNVNTLASPPLDVNLILNGSYTKQFIKKHFKLTDLTVYDVNIYKKTLPIINERLNLKLDIFWMPWSCCSKCCCTEPNCAHEFVSSKAICQGILSDQTRPGLFSLFKMDLTKPINIVPSLKAHYRGVASSTFKFTEIIKAANELNAYLTFEPYSISGIPAFSSLWHRSSTWLLIEKFLNFELQYRNPQKFPLGPLGMFIDIQSCQNLQQKHDCNVLQACLKDENLSNAFGALHVDESSSSKESTTESSSFFKPEPDPRKHQEECLFRGIEVIPLRNIESAIHVDNGFSYAFIMDENVFGTLMSVSWTSRTKRIPTFQSGQPCSQQKLFTDGFALMLLKVTREDCMMPYIVRGLVKDTGKEIRLRLMLVFKRKQKVSEYGDEIKSWSMITVAVLFFFFSFSIINYCFQVRSFKQKLAQTKALSNEKKTVNNTSKLALPNEQ